MNLSVRLAEKFPSNWELSTSRATQVVRYLSDLGVPPEKMSAVGLAEYRPVASNDTPEGKQRNRRIEIILYPKDLQEIAASVQPLFRGSEVSNQLTTLSLFP